jgi:hypothetical protein
MRIRRQLPITAPPESRLNPAELQNLPPAEFRRVISALLFDYLDVAVIKIPTPEYTAYEIRRVRRVTGRLGCPSGTAKLTPACDE